MSDDRAKRRAQPSAKLPIPSAQEQAHSEALVRVIRDEIEANDGSIDFARYMELALYAPSLGYYRGGAQKFGETGDFVTAPELSPVFARCLARQCQQILVHLGQGDLIDVGAGSGALAVTLLRELETLDALPERYCILELSVDLQERQRHLIAHALPHLRERVHWLQSMPAEPVSGVIIGNELLDAMPVHRFRVGEQGIEQLHIEWSDDRFGWCTRRPEDAVRERVHALALSPPYESEINLQAQAWVHSIAERLHAGVLLLIDYGFPRAEFYHPQRTTGTLMCHYRHRYHDNPLILAGLQDITAHVDFTAIAEAGGDTGLSALGYTSQAAFLLANGLEEFARAADPDALPEYVDLARTINTLTSPAEMGELYKVIALGRGIDIPLQGFSLHDRRGRL
ncbi:MAG: class I SAM-dependent methyltransferase [Acidiferrobacterales bacterium]